MIQAIKPGSLSIDRSPSHHSTSSSSGHRLRPHTLSQRPLTRVPPQVAVLPALANIPSAVARRLPVALVATRPDRIGMNRNNQPEQVKISNLSLFFPTNLSWRRGSLPTKSSPVCALTARCPVRLLWLDVACSSLYICKIRSNLSLC